MTEQDAYLDPGLEPRGPRGSVTRRWFGSISARPLVPAEMDDAVARFLDELDDANGE